MRLRFGHGLALGVAVGALGMLAAVGWPRAAPVDARLAEGFVSTAAVPSATLVLDEPPAVERSLRPYAGLGAWVDVFDYSPAYLGGTLPAVAPTAVADMAAHGVETLFLQAARLDDRTPTGLESRWLLYQFLRAAHDQDLTVVGWYLPYLADQEADLDRIRQIGEFEVFGQRFDGVAVDIEDTTVVPDAVERSRLLVELSQRLRAEVGADPVGAIVVPPVQTEVVNEQFWPDFPYADLADLYDVWLPMSYWSFRTESSGYRDGYAYNEESVRRLRDNLDDPDAVVHSIGGIGDAVSGEELTDFARSLADTGSIGGSVYDWSTLSEEARARLDQEFRTGAAADLPGP